MAKELTTKAIPAMIKKLDETGGLIDEEDHEAHDALKAKELLAQERIKELRKSRAEGDITYNKMIAGIKTIQKEILDQVPTLDDDDMDILS